MTLFVEDTWCRVVMNGFCGLLYECRAFFVDT